MLLLPHIFFHAIDNAEEHLTCMNGLHHNNKKYTFSAKRKTVQLFFPFLTFVLFWFLHGQCVHLEMVILETHFKNLAFVNHFLSRKEMCFCVHMCIQKRGWVENLTCTQDGKWKRSEVNQLLRKCLEGPEIYFLFVYTYVWMDTTTGRKQRKRGKKKKS